MRDHEVWILGPRADLVLLLGGVALSGAFAIAGLAGGRAALPWLFLLFQVGFNLPHYFQTYTLTYLDGAARVRHRRRLAGLGATAIAVPLLALLAPSPVPLRVLGTATLLWGFWHIAQQSWGFAALYLRRAGAAGPYGRFWARATLTLGCAFAVCFRLSRGSFGYAAGGLSQLSLLPPLPTAAAQATAALWAIASLGYGIWIGTRLGRRLPWSPLAAAMVTLTVAQFYVGLVVLRDFVLGLVFLTASHALQYLALVFAVQRGRTGRWHALAMDEEVVYFALAVAFALFATGLAEALPRPWGDAIYLPLLMTHYLNDNWLWKRASNPAVTAWLG